MEILNVGFTKVKPYVVLGEPVNFILSTTYAGLMEEMVKVGPPSTVLLVSCLSGIIQTYGSKPEPRAEVERIVGQVCQSVHGLIGRFPTMRVFIAQPTPRMDVHYQSNCTFAMVS